MQEADLIGEIDQNYFSFPVLDSILFDLLYTIIIISSKSLFNFINDNGKLSLLCPRALWLMKS